MIFLCQKNHDENSSRKEQTNQSVNMKQTNSSELIDRLTYVEMNKRHIISQLQSPKVCSFYLSEVQIDLFDKKEKKKANPRRRRTTTA